MLDSSLARALNEGEPVWQVSDFLIADVWAAHTGKPHPHRPKPRAGHPKEHDPVFLAARERARERARDRRRRIESGEIT